MLAREQNMELMETQEQVMNILLAPHMDPKKFSEYTKTVMHTLVQIAKQKQYSIARMLSREDQFVGSMREMIKVWSKLEENGTLAKWQEELNSLPEHE